jgi:hypothetical protein
MRYPSEPSITAASCASEQASLEKDHKPRTIEEIMRTSIERILTTHVGSLIRPPALQDIMLWS